MTAKTGNAQDALPLPISGRERYMIAAAIFLLIGSIAVFSVFQYQKIIGDTRTLLDSVSGEKVEQILQWRRHHLVEARETARSSDTIALMEAVIPGGDEKARLALLADFADFAKTYDYAASVAAGPDGLVAVSTSPHALLDRETVKTFPAAAESGSAVMTELHILSPLGKPGCNIVIPIFADPDSREKLLGFIVHFLEAQTQLYPIIDSWPVPSDTAENILIRKNEKETVFLSNLRSMEGSALSFTLTADNRSPTVETLASRESSGFRKGRNYGGRDVYAISKVVADTEWILVSEIDVVEVMKPWWKIFFLLGIILIVGMATAILFNTTMQHWRSSQKYRRLLESERNLRASERKFSVFMDYMPAMIMIKDRESRILFANAPMAARFPVDQWIGKAPEEVFDPAQAAITRERDGMALDEGYVEYEETRADLAGQDIFLLTQKFRILQDEAPPLIGQIMTDLTERSRSLRQIRDLNTMLEEKVKERTAQLEASNLELQTFTYSVSHDLRSPLRSLDGFAQLLAKDHAQRLDEEGLHYLERIRQSSGRMAELINDLLSLSKISTLTLRKEQVDIGRIANSITTEYIGKEIGRDVSISIQPSMVAPCDALLVDSLFRTLIDNAFKFSRGKARTVISVGSTYSNPALPGTLVYFVKDEGAGFDMAYKDSLFQPFHRLHGADEFPGNGIGLSIAKRIIDRHGGKIWLESKLGQGTTVWFTLGR